MATATRQRSSSRSKQADAELTHMSIEEQTAKFLKTGGKIEQVPTGLSGQTEPRGPRHITLGKKPNR